MKPIVQADLMQHSDPSDKPSEAIRRCDNGMPCKWQPSAIEPTGCKLVPVEPTPTMTEAGDLFMTNASFENVSPAQINAIYRAMLEAMTTPPDSRGVPK